MSAEEFFQWQEFAALEPLPSERVDMAGALVSSVIANANRGRGTKAYDLNDFWVVRNMLEKSRTDKEKIDREELHMRNFILSMGGSIH